MRVLSAVTRACIKSPLETRNTELYLYMFFQYATIVVFVKNSSFDGIQKLKIFKNGLQEC